MKRTLLFALCALIVAGCGIKRPLMPPSEIPDYEEGLRKKRERLLQEETTATTAPAVEVTK